MLNFIIRLVLHNALHKLTVLPKLFYLYSDLECVEYGPVKSDKPDGRQGPLFTHFIAYDKLKDFSDNKYTIEDILHQVEPQYNASSQAMFTDDIYHELPMICTHNDTNTISTLKFIRKYILPVLT